MIQISEDRTCFCSKRWFYPQKTPQLKPFQWKNIEVWRRLGEVIKMCSSRQSWTKYLKRSKEIKQNWSRAENFVNWFRLNFDCYYKSFISETKTGYYTLSPPNFSTSLIFPNVLTWQLMRQFVCNIFYSRCQSPPYLWWIQTFLKCSKAPKYYVHDCSMIYARKQSNFSISNCNPLHARLNSNCKAES